jgi:uncharacterized membrane protein YdjX (TVP38/TMEM64 family)
VYPYYFFAPFRLQKIAQQEVLLYRHGFWGIFLLAAWPNALFDLCGICCGHFLMPFWEFIGATMAGKALVKVHFLPSMFAFLQS